MLDERPENVEVKFSHLGLGHDSAVLAIVADRLAQPEGEWQSYARQAPRLAGALAPDKGRGVHWSSAVAAALHVKRTLAALIDGDSLLFQALKATLIRRLRPLGFCTGKAPP